MRRFLTLLLALLTLAAAAAADGGALLPLNGPAEIRLTFQADELGVLDATRLQDLNAMLGHVGVTYRLMPGERETWSALTLSVDGDDVASFTACEDDVATRVRFPGSAAVWRAEAGNPVEALFPEIRLDDALAGIPLTLTEDGDALLAALTADEEAFLITGEKQNINGYGATVTRRVLRANSGEELRERLLAAAGAAWLRQMLSSVTFADGCECYLLCDSAGETVKAVFRGTVTTPEGTFPNTQLTWRRKRAADDVRNGFELKMPKDGSAFSLSFRETDKTKGGVRTVTVTEFTMTRKAGNTTWKTTGDPIRVQVKDGKITGTVKLKTGTLKGTRLTDATQLTLNLAFDRDGAGEIDWKLQNKTAQEAWSGTAVFSPSEDTAWARFEEEARPLPENPEALAAIREQMTAWFSRRLTARLVLIDAQDTMYLRRGLEDSAWDEIVSAAEAALSQ